MLAYLGGDVFDLFGVLPDLVEELQIIGRNRIRELVDVIGNRIPPLIAEIDRRKTIEGQVNRLPAPLVDAGRRFRVE